MSRRIKTPRPAVSNCNLLRADYLYLSTKGRIDLALMTEKCTACSTRPELVWILNDSSKNQKLVQWPYYSNIYVSPILHYNGDIFGDFYQNLSLV